MMVKMIRLGVRQVPADVAWSGRNGMTLHPFPLSLWMVPVTVAKMSIMVVFVHQKASVTDVSIKAAVTAATASFQANNT